MADIKKKEYTIQINGIKESISLIDELKKSIDDLGERIDKINEKSINVKADNVKIAVPSANNDGLKEKDSLLQQIETTAKKIDDAQKEEYKNLLQQKTELKEIVKEKKSEVAQERLLSNAYNTNTMNGMKQKLADIKAVMGGMDIADSEFVELAKEADELNAKLLEIEKSYGQFGRNVGNYKSAFEGLSDITVKIGDTEVKFNSVREASRTLEQQLKAMVISGKEDTKEFKELSDAVQQFEKSVQKADSALNDLKASSTGMDAILDTFQSLAAVMSVSKGISNFFGLDNSSFEEAIRQLQSLQSTMQGIETLRKQMTTNEGFGVLFNKGSKAADNFAAKLTGVKLGINGVEGATKGATMAFKTLSVALKGLGIGLAVTAVLGLVEAFKMLTDRTKRYESELKTLDAQEKAINDNLKRRIDLINTNYLNKQITGEEMITQKLNAQNDALLEQIRILQQRAQYLGDSTLNGKVTEGYTFNPMPGAYRDTSTTRNLNIDDYEKAKKAIDELRKGLEDGSKSIDNFNKKISKSGKVILNNAIESIKQLTKDYKEGKISADDYYNTFKSNLDKLKNDDTFAFVRQNLETIIPDEDIRKSVEATLGSFDNVVNGYDRMMREIKRMEIENMPDGELKIKARIEFEFENIEASAQTEQQRQTILKNKQKKIEKEQKDFRNQQLQKQKAYNDKVLAADRDLVNMQIAMMKEGLAKQLTQLEEERKQKLSKIQNDGIKVAELTAAANQLYDKQINDAINESTKKLEDAYRNLWNKLYQSNLDILSKRKDLISQQFEFERKQAEDTYRKYFNQGIASYGIQGKNQISPDTQRELGIVSNNNDEVTKAAKEYVDALRKQNTALNSYADEYTAIMNRIMAIDKQLKESQNDELQAEKESLQYRLDIFKQVADNAVDDFKAIKQAFNDNFGELGQQTLEALQIEPYVKDITQLFDQRVSATRTYWTSYTELVLKQTKELQEKERKVENAAFAQRREDLNKQQDELIKENEEFYENRQELIQSKLKKGKITQEQANDELLEIENDYHDAINKIDNDFNVKSEQLQKEHQLNLANIERQGKEKAIEINKEKYASLLQELRDFQTASSSLATKQPVVYASGLINFGETKKNDRELLESYRRQADEVQLIKKELYNDFKDGLVDRNVYDSTIRELDRFTDDLGQKMDKVKYNLSWQGDFERWIGGMQQYIQAIGQTIQSVMSAVQDYQNYEFEQQQKALDKLNEVLANKLAKNEEILQRHVDNVNSIENELANARGSRREHLIDQLNAEIEAQRAAAAEEKRISKEQEKLKQQEDELNYQRELNQWKNNILSIQVAGAMAVTNALATQPFLPVGLLMGGLATALVAVQTALALSQKPKRYESGGLIEGKSHKQGGVKVLGGRAEVEGGEYIVNKHTTTQNLDILEYINSKKRKIDLSDMIEFYSSGAKASFKGLKPKYADGGYVPTLSNDIDISEQLRDIVAVTDNRPIYVSVLDINRQQENVRNVKVMAGLSE